MKLRQQIIDIVNYLTTNETLLRLLYYKPKNALDNPLDPSKEDILSMTEEEKWTIIDRVIIRTDKTEDLIDDPICRLCVYPGNREPMRNYYVSDQDVVFDIYTHYEYDQIDLRLSWLCDHLNELLFDKQITGATKTIFVIGHPIRNSPKGYTGYKLVYKFKRLD